MKDRYYYNMVNLIKNELFLQGVPNLLSEKQINYIANKNMFIVDVYRIIQKVRELCIQNNKKISFYKIKKIIEEEIYK